MALMIKVFEWMGFLIFSPILVSLIGLAKEGVMSSERGIKTWRSPSCEATIASCQFANFNNTSSSSRILQRHV